MVLWGTLVNTFAIILGGIMGLALPKLSQGIKATVMQGLGLAVAVQGVTMALKTNNLLIVIGSLVIGGVLGELLKVEQGLEKLGVQLEGFVGSRAKGKVAAGFVSTTLIYCVGAMAILGSIDSGVRLNHDMLYTKSMLDGFSAIIFASTLGVGVLFSSLPVLLYQGAIALSATLITSLISPGMLEAITAELTSVGGILIIGIGLNILEIKKINVANLLPSVVVAALLVPLVSYFS
ncbi:DUF554 domain-containing protein [Paenibacillus sp. YN15]|uniref:DUF554 domain-containing protein n=1 Tax=Paenibacillus sp. YN15 TaxID=1742774 RepID=UPI000DCF1D77|nr:DUF554 domain-containing protein [Paenibacillus sp. YN15]RAU96531.1 DUF554 domain-containing protein [Paenibacillus sp. YN15]